MKKREVFIIKKWNNNKNNNIKNDIENNKNEFLDKNYINIDNWKDLWTKIILIIVF